MAVTGSQLYYEVAGTGYPLVLIHAGVADCRMWDDQFSAFARHFRVIRYDARGFGKSRTEAVEFSNRQDLDDLLSHLGVRTAHLVGVSRGGQIAMDFTLERPSRVSALVMVASGPGGFKNPDPAPARETQMFEEIEATWERNEVERVADLEMQMWVDGPGQPADRVNPKVREKVRSMILSNYRTHVVEGNPIPLSPPAAGRVHEIRVPTFILVGTLDTTHIQAAAVFMERTIPNARKAVLHGTAHLPNMEQPEEFNRLVLEFLLSAGSPSPAGVE